MAAAVKTASEKATFAAALSKLTGLSPGVAAAWVTQENAGAGHAHNWLGMRPGVGATKGRSGVSLTTDTNGFAAFSSEADALKETAWWINNLPQYAGIKKSAGKTAATQITAIATSPWDSAHYASGGKIGAKLLTTFVSLKGSATGLLGNSSGGLFSGIKSAAGTVASTAGKVATAGGVFNPVTGLPVAAYDLLTGGVSKVADAATSPIESAGKTIVNWALEALIVLVLLALAAALFYSGIRRLTGDALPSASDLRQNASKGVQTAALAAA
jgi:hypothetical protein